MSKSTRFYAHPWRHTGRLVFPLLLGSGFFLFLWLMLTAHIAQAQSLACVPGPHSGPITADETWCAANSPHLLTGDVTVSPGVTLTVEPGTVVGGNTTVELNVQGHLIAIGTPAQPITFTSATNTAPNQWSGLVFEGGTGEMEYTLVRYGGRPNSINATCGSSGMGFNIAARNVLTGALNIRNSQIRSSLYNCNFSSADYGLYVNNSRVLVENSVIANNGTGTGGYAIYVTGANSSLSLAGNTFTANARNRVLMTPGAMTSASFTLVDEAGLESYEMNGDFIVPVGITMTVEPGVMVMATSTAVELNVQGHLEAVGTPTQPITFTSATNTGSNQWAGIVFDTGTGDLDYVTVRYGGRPNTINPTCGTGGTGFNIGIRNVLNGEVRIRHSQIRSAAFSCNFDSHDYGLYVSNSRVTVENTLFANNGNSNSTNPNNADYAVYAVGASTVLTFEGNIMRNNRFGLQLNGLGAVTLDNNVVMDNVLGGIHIAASTQAELRHSTLVGNGGDAVTVANGGVVGLVNSIVAENGTGVRVNTGGAAALTQTLWYNNGTNTVGTVNQTGSISGDPLLAADGYHLTRYSLAQEQGIEVGVTTDVDSQSRPMPANTPPDLGADEYYAVQELIFEAIALPPVWSVTQAVPSGSFTQRYLLPFRYGSPDSNAAPLDITITDTLPAPLALISQNAWPLMTFSQNGQALTWQGQSPLVRNQSGLIDITTHYDSPQSGQWLTNTAILQADTFTRTGQVITQVPVFTPFVVTPGTGELCPGPAEIQVMAQPGVTVTLSLNGVAFTQTLVNSSGLFTVTYPYAGLTTETLTVQACTAGGQCSPVSAGIELRPPQSFFCPQRSSWEGTPTVGPLAGEHLEYNFRDSSGEYSSQNWQISGVYGFWNTTLHLHGCNCPAVSGTTAPPSSVWVIADGVRYDPVGVYPDYTFNITGAAHIVEFWAQCGANLVSSSGRVLIDPDGYVFDVTQGFDAQNPTLNAIAGVTVTLYMSATEWGGWTPWPAHLFNNQVNPQVTENDGYFAFFTPPGFYYLQVEGKSGYQPWRSPVIQVVNEIVHVNVPYTPWINPQTGITMAQVLLTADGPVPASLEVQPGSVVQWSAEVDSLFLPTELAQQVVNPLLQVSSGLNPISNTVGWDGGKLIPGQTYQRQMNTPGIYTYSDGLGHQGQVCVGPCSPTATTLSGLKATTGTDGLGWLVVGLMGWAIFTLWWVISRASQRCVSV